MLLAPCSATLIYFVVIYFQYVVQHSSNVDSSLYFMFRKVHKLLIWSINEISLNSALQQGSIITESHFFFKYAYFAIILSWFSLGLHTFLFASFHMSRIAHLVLSSGLVMVKFLVWITIMPKALLFQQFWLNESSTSKLG